MIHTLKNGVRVVLVPLEHTATVSVGVFVNTGSEKETPEENGISHFLEHMAFKGTKKRSYNKISGDAERLGAEMNAFTDRDLTAYFINGLKDHATTFVDILGDIFCNSVFDAAEIEKEREVILQEYRMYADRSHYVAHDLSYELAYPHGAYGRKIIGEPKNIKAFTRDDLLNYVKKHYHGSNVVVGIAGSFDEREVFEAIEKAFAKVPKTDVHAELQVWKPHLKIANRDRNKDFEGGAVTKKKSVEQCAVSVMFETIGARDGQHYAYEVAAAVIGEGMSSPLFDEVREKRGLVYSIGASADTRYDCGVMTVTAGTTTEQVTELLTVTRQVIEDTSKKLKAVDLERAKNMLCVSTAVACERPFSLLLNNVVSVINENTEFDLQYELDSIRAVTPSAVKKALQNILSAKNVVAAVGKKIELSHIEGIF